MTNHNNSNKKNSANNRNRTTNHSKTSKATSVSNTVQVRRLTAPSSAWNGCLYVTISDARQRYNDSPKRAAALALAARTGNTSNFVYGKLVRSILKNGERVYFMPN